MINNSANIGKYIEPTEKLLDFAMNRLENYTENIISEGSIVGDIEAGDISELSVAGIGEIELDSSGSILVYDDENFLSEFKYTGFSLEGEVYTFEGAGELKNPAKTGRKCLITDATETLFKKIIKYTRTDYEGVFELKPQTKAPLALILYTGSNNGNMPRRKSEICILMITENRGSRDKSFSNVLTLLDKTTKALDHELFKKVVFEKSGDRPVAFEGLGVSAIDSRFNVMDF